MEKRAGRNSSLLNDGPVRPVSDTNSTRVALTLSPAAKAKPAYCIVFHVFRVYVVYGIPGQSNTQPF